MSFLMNIARKFRQPRVEEATDDPYPTRQQVWDALPPGEGWGVLPGWRKGTYRLTLENNLVAYLYTFHPRGDLSFGWEVSFCGGRVFRVKSPDFRKALEQLLKYDKNDFHEPS